MSTLFLIAIGGCAVYYWRRLSPKRRLVLLLVLAVAFVMLGCDTPGLAGAPWRMLRRMP